MSLTRVRLTNFTAFSDLSVDLSPGINVFVGRNGVGKTHLMKVCYAACEVATTGIGFSEKLVRVFRPRDLRLGRLVERQPGGQVATIEVARGNRRLTTRFATSMRDADDARTEGTEDWQDDSVQATFIPAEEVLADAPGHPASDNFGDLHTDEIHADLLCRALRPLTPGANPVQERLLRPLQPVLKGRVTNRNHQFFLDGHDGNLEFSLVAEGHRKIGLLWLLTRNGTLRNGSVLFWDEPETNLNPSVFGEVMETILELQRVGVQVFLATHDYVILKELDMRRHEDDSISFHSLFRSEGSEEVRCNTVDDYSQIHPNSIAEAFDDLYYRTIRDLADPPA